MTSDGPSGNILEFPKAPTDERALFDGKRLLQVLQERLPDVTGHPSGVRRLRGAGFYSHFCAPIYRGAVAECIFSS
jgi:hypothetical protein